MTGRNKKQRFRPRRSTFARDQQKAPANTDRVGPPIDDPLQLARRRTEARTASAARTFTMVCLDPDAEQGQAEHTQDEVAFSVAFDGAAGGVPPSRAIGLVTSGAPCASNDSPPPATGATRQTDCREGNRDLVPRIARIYSLPRI